MKPLSCICLLVLLSGCASNLKTREIAPVSEYSVEVRQLGECLYEVPLLVPRRSAECRRMYSGDMFGVRINSVEVDGAEIQGDGISRRSRFDDGVFEADSPGHIYWLVATPALPEAAEATSASEMKRELLCSWGGTADGSRLIRYVIPAEARCIIIHYQAQYPGDDRLGPPMSVVARRK